MLFRSTAKEECDDGNNASGDGCSSTCTKEPICGDSKKEGSEQCDDGNATAGDGCSSTCRLEAYCGNGTVEAGEGCDEGDRNGTAQSQCSVNCTRRVIR